MVAIQRKNDHFSGNSDDRSETVNNIEAVDEISNTNSLILNNEFVVTVGDRVDCIDETGHWSEAVIRKLDRIHRRVFVSFAFWDSKWDCWIGNVDERIAPLQSHTYYKGGTLKIGQRIECEDKKKDVMMAYIVDANPLEVLVHFYSYSSAMDEWISRKSPRIRMFGETKLKKSYHGKQWKVPDDLEKKSEGFIETKDVVDSCDRCKRLKSEDRSRLVTSDSGGFQFYSETLRLHNLFLFSVPGDGNCLFRSVSHQIYGNHEYHFIVRQKCMDYMEINREFFSQFVVGEFSEYLRIKRQNGVWGDDPEIEAICEIYSRPAEIWVFDSENGAKKLRTFHEAVNNICPEANLSGMRSFCSHFPIRLSYYGGGHYDSVTCIEMESFFLNESPGVFEDRVLTAYRNADRNSTNSNSHSEDVVDSNATNVSFAGRNNNQEDNVDADENPISSSNIDIAIEISRRAMHLMEDDIDSAWKASLSKDSDISTLIGDSHSLPSAQALEMASTPIDNIPTTTAEAQVIRSNNPTSAEDDDLQAAIEASLMVNQSATTLMEDNDDEIFKAALEESIHSTNEDDDLLQAAIAASMLDIPGQKRFEVLQDEADEEDEELQKALTLSMEFQ